MEQLLEGLNLDNSAIQQMQGENLKSLYKNESKGVKAKDAF